MRPDRVIKLPVFRTMFTPVARKAWKCDLCNEPVEVGRRYIHYIDRQTHKITSYRFHLDCFGLVEAYCYKTKQTAFTPLKARNWAKKTYCARCKETCEFHLCHRMKAVIKALPKRKKIENTT